jgi:hypothetical protein
MRDIFACGKCHAIHEITRLRERPAVPPRCQVCHASFPPSELGDWFTYKRAEPEWSVSEWLTGKASPGRPSRQLKIEALVDRVMRLADPALPSSAPPLDER